MPTFHAEALPGVVLCALLVCATPSARGADESEGHASQGYRFTRQATYLYTDFLEGDDATTLGLETDAKFGLGKLHARHIMYLEVMDYPRAIPGKRSNVPDEDPDLFEAATGISDLLTGLWLSPAQEGHPKLELGYGIGMQLPTASDDSLGYGKWAAGPSVDIEYRSGPLFVGGIVMQLWSFAGDDDRKEVNTLITKYFITYDVGANWKLISIPYGVTYYWDKPSSEALSLPVGGGIQRNLTWGSQEFSLQVQYFEYVARPEKGSEADLRLTLEWYF